MNITNRFLAVGALVVLAACGGGGYGGGGGGPPALSLQSTTPRAGATGISRKSTVVLTFSAALDATTLNLSAITLASGGAIQPFTTNVNGNTLTITPVAPLAPFLPYTLTLGVGLRGTGGEALAGSVTTSFTTADRGWQTATRIEPVGPLTAERPKVVVDQGGNATAVWQRRDSATTRSIWSNRYRTGAGWGTPIQISPPGNNAEGPALDVNPVGDVVAVWEQIDNGTSRIWSNRFSEGAWGTARQIQTVTDATGTALAPQVAIDIFGNAVAVWEQSENGVFGIWANRYIVGANWGTAAPIGASIDSGSPQVALDVLRSNGFAIWIQTDGVWTNQFTMAAGWGTPKMIASASAMTAFFPRVSVDALGNVHAVWSQSDESNKFDIRSSHFTVGGDWSAPEIIDDHAGASGNPKIVSDVNGNVYAVWGQSANVAWNHYTAGQGWGTPGIVGNGLTGGDPDVGLDRAGVVLALWEANGDMRSSRLTPPATTWTDAVHAGNVNIGADPSIAVDVDGDAVAVWEEEETDGTSVAIRSNRFE